MARLVSPNGNHRLVQPIDRHRTSRVWRNVVDAFKAIGIIVSAVVAGIAGIGIWLLLATAPIIVILLVAKYLFF